MEYKSKELIEMFYKSLSEEEKKELSKDKVNEIIRHSWKWVKNQIEDNDLPKIRLQYFGLFVVYPGRVKANLRKLTKSKNFNGERYEEVKATLKNYLKRHENNN